MDAVGLRHYPGNLEHRGGADEICFGGVNCFGHAAAAGCMADTAQHSDDLRDECAERAGDLQAQEQHQATAHWNRESTGRQAGNRPRSTAKMNVSVIGAGAWGTALANLLCRNGHDVTLWGHDPDHLAEARKKGVNEIYLPGIRLAEALRFETDLARATAGKEVAVLAPPSRHFREIASQLAGFAGLAVSVTKGIEYDTGLTMSGVIGQTMPKAAAAVL